MINNNGGRVTLSEGMLVKIFDADGTISEDFLVHKSRSDRRGMIELLDRKSGLCRKVHNRRVLNDTYKGENLIIFEVAERYYAQCRLCNRTIDIDAEGKRCDSCGSEDTFWLCQKPRKLERPTLSPKAEKMAKEKKEINIEELANLPNCQLWYKNTNFDHVRISVVAYALLYSDNTNHRKYCFNTYDGTLGKGNEELKIKEFLQNEPSKKWFKISDMSKALKKLQKDGYEIYKT